MLSFLRKTLLWLLLAPYAVWGLGLASNQAVLIANHDKFPVMVNAVKLAKIIDPEFIPVTVQTGMIDDTHCIMMTAQTHLNFLADIFDLGHGIYSVGDFLLMAGENSKDYCLFAWILLMSARAARQPE
jgi:hypothetical protein